MTTDTGWFVIYKCGCTDLQRDKGKLPKDCPVHDYGHFTEPELLAGAELISGFRAIT